MTPARLHAMLAEDNWQARRAQGDGRTAAPSANPAADLAQLGAMGFG
jgi:hypothetical protein